MRIISPSVMRALALASRSAGSCPAVGLSKRCVVAYELRGVASEYGQSPRRVLAETFQKKRRVARTQVLMRMSRRLAIFEPVTIQKIGAAVQQSVIFEGVKELRTVSKRKADWRPLSICVERVLRDVRAAGVSATKTPPASKAN